MNQIERGNYLRKIGIRYSWKYSDEYAELVLNNGEKWYESEGAKLYTKEEIDKRMENTNESDYGVDRTIKGLGEVKEINGESFNMGFDGALNLLETGERICRSVWNGKGMYLIRIPGEHLARSAGYGFGEMVGEPTFGNIIMIKTSQNKLMAWNASQEDIQAKDWQLVK